MLYDDKTELLIEKLAKKHNIDIDETIFIVKKEDMLNRVIDIFGEEGCFDVSPELMQDIQYFTIKHLDNTEAWRSEINAAIYKARVGGYK